MKITDTQLPNKYQSVPIKNRDVDNSFDKLINSNLNISEINNDNVMINKTKARPLYKLL